MSAGARKTGRLTLSLDSVSPAPVSACAVSTGSGHRGHSTLEHQV